MDLTPAHRIDITHRKQIVCEERNENGFVVQVYKCIDCGTTSETVDLDSIRGHEKGRTSSPQHDRLNTIKEIHNQLKSEVVKGTKYVNIDEAFEEMEKKYKGEFDPSYIPFRALISWGKQSTWAFKRKALLIYKQGHVCNRCDSIFVHASKLTVDHINKNRNDGRLSNLQLLCLSCHEEKNRSGNKVTDRDVSPFLFKGEQCVHKISCVAYLDMRRED